MTFKFDVDEAITALCEGLRSEAHDFMGDVTRVGLHDNFNTVPIARLILNDYDTSMAAPVFVLSIQSHLNLYYDDVAATISSRTKDAEADTLSFLSIHYILSNEHLTRVT